MAERQRRRAVRAAGSPEGATATDIAVAVDLTKQRPSPATPADVGERAGSPASAESPWLGRAAVLAAGVLVLALVAAAGFLGWQKHSADQRDAQRQEFVSAARQVVLNLTTIHVDTAKQDVERILATASGSLRDEFASRIDPFVSIVQTAKVNTDGEIIDAAIEKERDGGADVLVVAKSMVTNSGSPEKSPRQFRLRVTVRDEGDRVTTENVEFVP